MTNEEFHGMLMSALHGPHAREIAEQVVGALGADSLVAAHDAMHEGERRALWHLVHLAIADHLPDPTREQGMMQTIMRRTSTKGRIVAALRRYSASLMASSRDSESTRALAEVLGIDLDAMEDPTDG